MPFRRNQASITAKYTLPIGLITIPEGIWILLN